MSTQVVPPAAAGEAASPTAGAIRATGMSRGVRVGYLVALGLAVFAPMLGLYPVFVMKLLCFALFACAFLADAPAYHSSGLAAAKGSFAAAARDPVLSLARLHDGLRQQQRPQCSSSFEEARGRDVRA